VPPCRGAWSHTLRRVAAHLLRRHLLPVSLRRVAALLLLLLLLLLRRIAAHLRLHLRLLRSVAAVLIAALLRVRLLRRHACASQRKEKMPGRPKAGATASLATAAASGPPFRSRPTSRVPIRRERARGAAGRVSVPPCRRRLAACPFVAAASAPRIPAAAAALPSSLGSSPARLGPSAAASARIRRPAAQPPAAARQSPPASRAGLAAAAAGAAAATRREGRGA
jgi:hypothetical protein